MEDKKKTKAHLISEIEELRERVKQLEAGQKETSGEGATDEHFQRLRTLAHDFNNRLTPIIGFTEFILKNPSMMKDKRQLKTIFQSIHDSATAAEKMLTDFRRSYGGGKPSSDG